MPCRHDDDDTPSPLDTKKKNNFFETHPCVSASQAAVQFFPKKEICAGNGSSWVEWKLYFLQDRTPAFDDRSMELSLLWGAFVCFFWQLRPGLSHGSRVMAIRDGVASTLLGDAWDR